MRGLVDDFVVFGVTVGRPTGWRQFFVDVLCRYTGHLLWRSMSNAGYRAPGDSLTHYTCHCRRCWKWGYIRGDYKPETPAPLTDQQLAEAVAKVIRENRHGCISGVLNAQS